MLQVLEGLLVDLGVQHIVHRIHLRLPILLVDVPLLLHLARRIAVLLDVHLVRGALHRQAIDLLSKLQDVALVLTEATLHAAHAQVEGAQSPGGLCAAELRLLLHGADLLEGLLLLLPDVVLQARLGVSNIALQVAANHRHLVEAITQGILRRVQALLRSSQVLVREVNAAVQGVHGLVRVAGDLGLGLLQVRLHGRDVVTDGGQDLVHLATARINIQAQRGYHVTHGLDRRIKVVVGLLPSDVVHLGVQLRVHLVLQVDDVLGEVLLLLLHLLKGVRHVLHPRVVVLQRLLDVTDVQPHRRDLSSHRGFHTLPAGDDGMCGVDPRAHLVEIHVHGIHGRREVLHVALASQHDPADVVHLALVVAKQVLQLANIVLQLV
mmetsp:Transcript_102299/g.266839  ORF Transcript_102299/g.266839 Transcript_102299/m.266839 type:complete len:379 (-) Transcript_102299:374-1510(-)